MIHVFPENMTWKEGVKFTNPFRYAPHQLVRHAAESVITELDRRIKAGEMQEAVCNGFREGKMLGVLVCESGDPGQGPIYLAGFSGSVGGCSTIEGFVPPIYDLLDPCGYFKEKEAEITQINKKISEISTSDLYKSMKSELTDCERLRDAELQLMREEMGHTKEARSRRRAEGCDKDLLVRESQFEKAEFKRLKALWKSRIDQIKEQIDTVSTNIQDMKSIRAKMSDELQGWIFRQYKVHNAFGEESTIYDIFANKGLVPPGGTGDCAAPKLLEYAYRNNLKPLAMGEFWYGISPDTAVRTQGHFYPSCTSRCEPLLGFMMRGLAIEEDVSESVSPTIIYKDEAIIAVSKPSGMPSVPGLDGRISAQEWLSSQSGCPVHSVHRLDMDTSGVLLFAKTENAAVELMRQFEAHTIRKTYMARLCAPEAQSTVLHTGAKGQISLPLSPDYDERPRQKADKKQGKEAITDYEVLGVNPDGTIDIEFRPITGRTHQLRVHSAHHLGLGRPILGDLLYGGQSGIDAGRLHLHARSITFLHPTTGIRTTLESQLNLF